MPVMGGVECLSQLRMLRDDVRVVISSGFPEKDLASRFQVADIAGYIHKPYELSKLAMVLKKAFAS
jgi:DNA-binding NarL/FixJ family response regulator